MTDPNALKASACEAIFFDFDGVLADSVHVKSDAFAALYKDRGPDVMEQVVAYHLAHGGLSRYKKIEYFQREIIGESANDAVIAALADKFANLVKAKVIAADPIPGADETLAALRGGCPLFVISGTPGDELREIVDRRGMSGYFVSVHGSPQSKTDILGELLDIHRYTPNRCLMVGDALEDHAAAEAYGVHFVGIVPSDGESRFPPGTQMAPNLKGFTEMVIGK